MSWWRWLAAACLGLATLAQAEQALTLVFAGDTTLDDEPGELIARGGDPLASFAPLFAQADLRIANLECVVATGGHAGNKNYTFRAHPRVLPVLRRRLASPSGQGRGQHHAQPAPRTHGAPRSSWQS